jgi:hypothetical protein
MLTLSTEQLQSLQHLSSEELHCPQLVMADFFDFASLTEARACLVEWLLASFEAQDGHEQNYIHLFRQLERLLEANWLIHRQQAPQSSML